MKNKQYAVIGLGQFGVAIAMKLSNKGADVLAIDNDKAHIDVVKDFVSCAVILDSTDKSALESQGIKDVDAVVLAIGKNFEDLLLTAVYLKEIGVKRIIARAHGPQQMMILKKIGIEEILSPEEEVAFVIAERLINPNILTFMQLPSQYEVVEIKTPKSLINNKINTFKLQEKYKLSIIAIKRNSSTLDDNGDNINTSEILGISYQNETITKNDTLIVFGKFKDINKFIEIN